MSAELEAAVRELERGGARAARPDVDPARAAELVDRCAEIAAEIGKELDRAGREAERDAPSSGQERLL